MEQAIELSKRLQEKPAPAAKAPPVNGARRTAEPMTAAKAEEIVAGLSDWVVPNAIAFLETISAARPHEVTSAQMMANIGLTDAKAFGGRSAAINKLLSKLDFNPDNVYETAKTRGGRYWKARTKIDEALMRVKALRTV